MRLFLVALVLVSFFAGSAYSEPASRCEDIAATIPLAQRMNCMSYIAEMIFAYVNKVEKKAEVIQGLEKINAHLVQALNATPRRLQHLKAQELRRQKLEFQQLLAEALITVNQIEHRLITSNAETDEKLSSDYLLNALVTRLHEVILKGHSRYR